MTIEELIILDHHAYRRRRKRKKPDWDLELEELFEDEDGRVFFQYEGSGGEGSGGVRYYRTYIEEIDSKKLEEPCFATLFRFNNQHWSCWVDVVVTVFVVTCFFAVVLAVWKSRRTKSLTFDSIILNTN